MRRIAGVTLAAALAVSAVASRPLQARQACRPLDGHFEARLVPPPGCASAVGVCTAGRVWGGLQGDYQFTMSKLVPTGEPETPSIAFFTGRSVVHAKGGDLLGVDTGTIDLPPGQGGFASLITWTGGTGAFAGATGQIRLRGFLDAAAGTTSGDYEGSICVP
jgi:hypothetical protein